MFLGYSFADGLTSFITNLMTPTQSLTRRRFEFLLPVVVLAILLIYSYARFFMISYVGFQFHGASGVVVEVYGPQAGPPFLRQGDVLLAVDGKSWDELHEGFQTNPLVRIDPGEVITLQVQDGEEVKVVEWVATGFNMPEFWTRMINTWPMGYGFWLAGTAALLLVRPKDERWALLVAFNYITAIWFTAGSLSSWGVLSSGLILRAGVWLSLPIYLHFHWNFPYRIRTLPRGVWVFLYVTSVGFLIAHGLGWIDRDAYLLAFLAAVIGSASILLVRFIWRPIERREIGLLFFATTVAFLPALAVIFYRGQTSINPVIPGLLFSILALPGAYFYVVYRRQLGGLELRANRLIALYLFAVLLVTLALALFPLVSANAGGLQDAGSAIAITALLATLVTSLGFSGFQSFVEKRLLRIPQTPEGLLPRFIGQISTSIEYQNLADLLKHEVLPSLLIRQSALIHFDEGNHDRHVVYFQGIKKVQLLDRDGLRQLMENPEAVEEGEPDRGKTWVRLALPLRVGGITCGLWLLGRKDPDDYYHQNERVLLTSLADQMAIALTNISQARSLRALHQADIERQEAERIHLARELHDDVLPRLNEMGVGRQDPAKIDQLIARIRRLMAGLRPPLLEHGLYLALEQLVVDLRAKLPGSTNLVFQVRSTLVRFDATIEQHLFRIVQQACENSLTHGSPKTLNIKGQIHEEGFDLWVEDDGTGFKLEGSGLADLLKARHFGLAGMSERAAMIGANLDVVSALGKGTKVHLVWPSRDNKTGS